MVVRSLVSRSRNRLRASPSGPTRKKSGPSLRLFSPCWAWAAITLIWLRSARRCGPVLAGWRRVADPWRAAAAPTRATRCRGAGQGPDRVDVVVDERDVRPRGEDRVARRRVRRGEVPFGGVQRGEGLPGQERLRAEMVPRRIRARSRPWLTRWRAIRTNAPVASTQTTTSTMTTRTTIRRRERDPGCSMATPSSVRAPVRNPTPSRARRAPRRYPRRRGPHRRRPAEGDTVPAPRGGHAVPAALVVRAHPRAGDE